MNTIFFLIKKRKFFRTTGHMTLCSGLAVIGPAEEQVAGVLLLPGGSVPS
jgi:hypothetical protein